MRMLETTQSVSETNMVKNQTLSDCPWKTKMNLQSMWIVFKPFWSFTFFNSKSNFQSTRRYWAFILQKTILKTGRKQITLRVWNWSPAKVNRKYILKHFFFNTMLLWKKISNFFSYTRPDIKWYRDQEEVLESPKYHFYRAIQPSNPNIHFVRLTIVVSCL